MHNLKVDTAHLTSYIAMQGKEILENKWYLSKKEGRDVGLQYAIEDWNKHHAQTFHDNFYKHKEAIDEVCKRVCHLNCKGIEGCVLSNKTIHELLED